MSVALRNEVIFQDGDKLVYRFAQDLHNMEEYLCNNFHSWDFLYLLQFFIVVLCFAQPMLSEAAGVLEILQELIFFYIFCSPPVTPPFYQ